MRRWARPAAVAAALALVLGIVTAGIISGFTDIDSQDVIRRTATPVPPTNTPTITDTPTETFTPTETSTPTNTPTPFPTKNASDLGGTVVIGGSTGASFLDPFDFSYVPVFDAGISDEFGDVGHVVLPGALRHLTVKLSSSVSDEQGYTFTIVVNGEKTSVFCSVPAKGKGDFCEAGDKFGGCVELGPQDNVAVQVTPHTKILQSQVAGFNGSDVQMSWSAKLDLYGSCPDPIGQNSCQGVQSCLGATGFIGDNSCNDTQACIDQTGIIGDGSCNGIQACIEQVGNIGDGSCNDTQACFWNNTSIGNGQCNGVQNCIGPPP